MVGRPDLSGYTYGPISSLVLTADMLALPRRDKEPAGAQAPGPGPTSIDSDGDPRSEIVPERTIAESESLEVYELILSSVHNAIAPNIVRSTAGTVLETLIKNGDMKDLDLDLDLDRKKEEIEQVLRTMLSEHFSQLVSLSKRIANYNAEDESVSSSDMERKDDESEDEVGEDEEEQEEGRGRGRV